MRKERERRGERRRWRTKSGEGTKERIKEAGETREIGLNRKWKREILASCKGRKEEKIEEKKEKERMKMKGTKQ